MDDQRVGTTVRLLRIRRGLRQVDLARIAGVSQPTVSRLERGHFASLSLLSIRSVAAALDLRLDLMPRWRGGDLDRMLNARHSRLHELVARRFAELPTWSVAPEVSFAIRGERGVIDILAFHQKRDMLLAVELKTEIVDVNDLIGTLDRKKRLAAHIARERGWLVGHATRVSAWVIVAESRTNHRRVDAHRAVLRAAFPTDGRVIPGWLVSPREQVRALSFWPDSHPGNARGGLASVRRVRRRPPRTGAPAREHPEGARERPTVPG